MVFRLLRWGKYLLSHSPRVIENSIETNEENEHCVLAPQVLETECLKCFP